jgi:hypothetical protein
MRVGGCIDGQFRSKIAVQLIASDEEQPKVRIKPGKHYNVVATSIVDSDLETIKDETEERAGFRPARPCGSRSTCLAIVEIEAE